MLDDVMGLAIGLKVVVGLAGLVGLGVFVMGLEYFLRDQMAQSSAARPPWDRWEV